METYRTGADHHMYCSLALVLVAILSHQRTSRALRAAATLFVCGIVLFSAPCYAIAILGVRQLGTIAPLGGIAMITAWLLVGVHAWAMRGGR
jgi:uncharacterized membrane protein YgdD (TMEM256/DUF423 family)